MLDTAANSILGMSEKYSFELSTNFLDSMISLSEILVDHCQCQVVDMYKLFLEKYKRKYFKSFEGKTKNEIIELLRKDYNDFKQILKNMNVTNVNISESNFLEQVADNFTGLYGFSIESELHRLIPNELGSLKQFFITVISKYYNNLHPVVWAQIFKGLTENVFTDLPFSTKELFQFGSKQLLLNSGPFILKILQMIRPILSPELAQKYNLTKLTYPVLKSNEVDLILGKVVYNWDMYNVLQHFSASVGHVVKVVRVDKPSHIFIIKIIKPLAVAQSCWEYETLYDIYPNGTCEQTFIINMLESNGIELNVQNEIDNINEGHKVYTATYHESFGVDIDAKLTTVQNIPGFIREGCWFALTMTLAPGVPLSKLIENDELKEDTKYRAKLHRCLDILVYKFFHNIVKNGYYHGDLHSGNIFYSYDESQMTLIDFGAVGKLNIYENDKDIKTLLDIVIMSLFYNYDEMLDTITQLLNKRCMVSTVSNPQESKSLAETQIDQNSQLYQELKAELHNHKLRNIENQDNEQKKAEIYKTDIFSAERIQQEKSGALSDKHNYVFDANDTTSIYSYIEYKPKGAEIIVENKDVLPNFTEIVGDSENISFSGVLEKIIKFYAQSGVNIAIKFSEFYEFQKAYALILGVLHKVGYNSYRIGIAIRKAIISWNNVSALSNVGTISHVVKKYWEQNKKFDELKSQITKGSMIKSTLKKNSSIIPTSNNTNAANKNTAVKNYPVQPTKQSVKYTVTKKSPGQSHGQQFWKDIRNLK